MTSREKSRYNVIKQETIEVQPLSFVTVKWTLNVHKCISQLKCCYMNHKDYWWISLYILGHYGTQNFAERLVWLLLMCSLQLFC